LRKADKNVPEVDANFFKKNVIIAAFLGTRPTGGDGIAITPETIPPEIDGTGIRRSDAVQCKITEQRPGHDVMVPQVVTCPFKIVSVSPEFDADVRVNLDDAWSSVAENYRLNKGEFKVTGGFYGGIRPFQLTGEIRIIRLEKLATFLFALRDE